MSRPYSKYLASKVKMPKISQARNSVKILRNLPQIIYISSSISTPNQGPSSNSIIRYLAIMISISIFKRVITSRRGITRKEKKRIGYFSTRNPFKKFYDPSIQGLVCCCFLWFNVPVNNYGHVETVGLPNHTVPGLGRL